MRVLRTYTGKVTHLPARNAYEAHEPFPACTPVGTAVSNGITRFYFHTAGAVTCKRCLRILEKLVTEAYAMHAAHMMTPEGQAQEDELAARRAEKCGQCGSERSNPRHHSAEGHAFVDRAAEPVELLDLPARDTGTHGDDGLYVELSSGLTEYVEPGHRLQHKDTAHMGTVRTVGPNALDLTLDSGQAVSGASWYWGRPLAAELPEVDPIDRQAVLSPRVDSLPDSGVHTQKCRDNSEAATCDGSCTRSATGRSVRDTRLYTPSGEAMVVLGSAVHGNGLRAGVWGVREGRPLALAFFVDEEHLRLQFSAYRPGERAKLADATRMATPLATPSQVAELATAIAEQAELFAAGGVPEATSGAFSSRMVGNVQTLARWLGMSEPVPLASYASPYGGPDLVDDTRRAHRSSLEVSSARIVEGVRAARSRAASMPLCRQPSSRWTAYGATCNTPLAADGTCSERRLHV